MGVKCKHEIPDFLKFEPFEYTDKENSIALYVQTMLNRTQQIFEYKGLPETIPARMLELYMQRYGFACITKVNGELYAFNGGLGGTGESVYYQPTFCTVSNPALNFSKQLEIGTDCEIIRNDANYLGLFPLFVRYATALAENDLSLDMANTNMRAQFAISAPDDASFESAMQFLEDLKAGKASAIASNEFLDGIKINPMMQASLHTLQELTEYQQYIKASWYNEIGLNANFNMKRENLNESETEMNFDALIPLIENMLSERKEGIERINKLYNTNISVSLRGVWEKTVNEMTKPEDEQTEEAPEENENSNQLERGEAENVMESAKTE